MNGTTKSDLSAGIVKLDYDALTKTAAIAVRAEFQNAKDAIGRIDRALSYNNYTTLHVEIEFLVRIAYKLSIAADTYAALKEGETREEKILINLPK